MAYEITMPRLSDTMDEGKLISWRVREGESVGYGDVIAEVESDKAIMEVQTFEDGVVEKLFVREGETVPVGETIALIGNPDKKADDSEREKSVAKRNGAERGETSPGSVHRVPQKVYRVHRRIAEKESTPAKSGMKKRVPQKVGMASPKARIEAARYDLDFQKLQREGALPTPAHQSDIQNYILRRHFTPKALKLMESYGLSPELFEGRGKLCEDDIAAYIRENGIALFKPFEGSKKALVSSVERSAGKPVFHIYDSITAEFLERYAKEGYTITVWLLKIFAEAMREHPPFRCAIAQGGVLQYEGASIALAVAEGERLYMPVFRNVDGMDMDEISSGLEDFRKRAKNGRMKAEDFEGSTFAISNLGMMGIERFDAMINADDSAIAAVGALSGGRISVTLSVDHRIANGLQAAEFMQSLKRYAGNRDFFEKNSRRV